MSQCGLTKFEIWTVVDAGLASLVEVQTEWSLDDLYSALEYLDIKSAIDEVSHDSNK